MFYWFILALFGFCSLRLAGVFSNWTYSIASALGLEQIYRPLLNLLMCLALFGIFFFYNLTDVVILREIDGSNYNTSKIVLFCIWLSVCAFHPSNIPSYLGNTFALAVITWALTQLYISVDLTSIVLYTSLVLCFSIEWLFSPRLTNAKLISWSNDVVCVLLALIIWWYWGAYYNINVFL